MGTFGAPGTEGDSKTAGAAGAFGAPGAEGAELDGMLSASLTSCILSHLVPHSEHSVGSSEAR